MTPRARGGPAPAAPGPAAVAAPVEPGPTSDLLPALRGRSLVLACAALFALRIAWGWALLNGAVARHGVLNTSLDELLHLRGGLLQAARPFLSLPPIDWQPPALYTVLGLAFRASPAEPWWTAAAVAVLASAGGTVAAALAARRIAGGGTAAFVAGGLLYSGAGLLNAVGLVPALPHGLLLPAYALAIWLCTEAAARPALAWTVPAALALSVLPLVRYEALAYALALAGLLLVLAPRSLPARWPLLLVPLPLAAVLLAGGAGGLTGRTAMLARDAPPGEAATMALLGPLATLKYLSWWSPAVGVAGLAALAAFVLRGRRAGPPALVALVAALAPALVIGLLFLRGETGAAPYRLVAPLAVPLAMLAAAWITELAAPTRRSLLAGGAALLALLATDHLRFDRKAPHANASLFEVARTLRAAGLQPAVERVTALRSGYGPMLAALAGSTAPRTFALTPDPATAIEAALAGGHTAAVLLSADGIAAARARGARLVLADGPDSIAVVLPRSDDGLP